MSSADLFVKINSLPAELRKLVEHYVEYLSWRKDLPKEDQTGPPDPAGSSPDGKKIPFGKFKGKVHLADDFDAPLDDLKEYM